LVTTLKIGETYLHRAHGRGAESRSGSRIERGGKGRGIVVTYAQSAHVIF